MEKFIIFLTVAGVGLTKAWAGIYGPHLDVILRAVPTTDAAVIQIQLCAYYEPGNEAKANCQKIRNLSKQTIEEHFKKIGYDKEEALKKFNELEPQEKQTGAVASTAAGATFLNPLMGAVALAGLFAADRGVGQVKKEVVNQVHPLHLLQLVGISNRLYLPHFHRMKQRLEDSLKAIAEGRTESGYSHQSGDLDQSRGSEATEAGCDCYLGG